MEACWSLVAYGEKISDDQAQWSVNWDAFREFRESGHPIFDGDIAPWEFAEIMRLIAHWKNEGETPGRGLLPVTAEDGEEGEED